MPSKRIEKNGNQSYEQGGKMNQRFEYTLTDLKNHLTEVRIFPFSSPESDSGFLGMVEEDH